jgi:hypothetical protein
MNVLCMVKELHWGSHWHSVFEQHISGVGDFLLILAGSRPFS